MNHMLKRSVVTTPFSKLITLGSLIVTETAGLQALAGETVAVSGNCAPIWVVVNENCDGIMCCTLRGCTVILVLKRLFWTMQSVLSREVYRAYASMADHERYLERKDRANGTVRGRFVRDHFHPDYIGGVNN